MKLVEHHLRVTAVLRHAALVGPAHVHARLRDGVAVTIVCFQRRHKFQPRFLVLAFGGEEHPPQPRVGFPDGFGHLAHGHLAHEQQREGVTNFFGIVKIAELAS